MEKTGKKDQLLLIEPQNELKFVGPFTQNITSHMRLTNPTDKTILFKIKTTAPKKYCVRPNCGTLQPKVSVEVAIILQPFIFDPNEKNKHKFMVQSLVAPDNSDIQFDALWKDVKPDQLMDSKLKCVFDLPEDNSVVSADDDKKLNDLSTDATDTNVSELVNELRQERIDLRAENLQLKEQVRRLLVTVEATSAKESDPFHSPYSSYSSQQQQQQHGGGGSIQQQQQPIPMMYIIIAFAMIVFGIIMGKFIL